MAVNRGNHTNNLPRDAKGAANAARENHMLDALIRVGYFARGIVYGLIGFLAVQTIFTGRGKITDPKGALSTIATYPFGKFVLILVAIGLVGLVLWGLIRAIADPYHKGDDAKGIANRLGYLVSGISYGVLLLPTLNLINGSGRTGASSSQSAQNAAAGIMSKPGGTLLIGLIGAVLLCIGAYRAYLGYQAKFNERFKSYEMTADERRWAIRMGRFGYIAHGTVLAIIGILALIAATTYNPNQVGSLDAALLFLSRQPYGPWLLAVVALGLIAFAIYSFMGAFWFRIKEL